MVPARPPAGQSLYFASQGPEQFYAYPANQPAPWVAFTQPRLHRSVLSCAEVGNLEVTMEMRLIAVAALVLSLATGWAEGIAAKWSWMPGDPASPVVTEPGRNILDNSSFEQGTGGWSCSSGERCDWEPDPTQAHALK